MSQGRAANKNGASFRNVCCAVLRQFDIAFSPEFPTGRTGVMGKAVTVDIAIHRATGFEEGLYIECRYQKFGGSVEDKTPCLFQNIEEVYDCPTIVVSDGGGASKIREYLLGRIGGGNLRGVMSLSEFFAFAESVAVGNGSKFIQDSFDPDQRRFWQ